ncbi:hypothetical protein LINPERHAP1_LOCUS12192, partial [Linum perenne]
EEARVGYSDFRALFLVSVHTKPGFPRSRRFFARFSCNPHWGAYEREKCGVQVRRSKQVGT